MVTKERGDGVDIAGVIEVLAAKHNLLHATGEVNYTAFARRLGIPPPTVMRWHKGITRDVSTKAIASICRAFNISMAQARGFEPISKNKPRTTRSYKPNQQDIELLRQLRSLTPDAQHEIESFIRTRLKLQQELVRETD